MSNKRYIMCLECGNVQVRTDIEKVISNNYIILSNQEITCVRCISRKNIVTNNIKELSKKLESKQETTSLDKRVKYLLKRVRI